MSSHVKSRTVSTERRVRQPEPQPLNARPAHHDAIVHAQPHRRAHHRQPRLGSDACQLRTPRAGDDRTPCTPPRQLRAHVSQPRHRPSHIESSRAKSSRVKSSHVYLAPHGLVGGDAPRDDEAREVVARGLGPAERALRPLGEVGDGHTLEGGGHVREMELHLR
jgi:hypothetical protein